MHSGNNAFKNIKKGNIYYHVKLFSQTRLVNFYREFFVNYYLSSFQDQLSPFIYKKSKSPLSLTFLKYQPLELTDKNSINYINKIKLIHEYEKKNHKVCPILADQAFDNSKNVLESILLRIKYLNKYIPINNNDYSNHLEDIKYFFEELAQLVEYKKQSTSLLFNHGDSGLHNCVKSKKSLLITDLEYAGNDSPIKQCIDYLVHPLNQSDKILKEIWFNYFWNKLIHKEDKRFCNIYFSLFTLKWSLIILNEFIPEIWALRVNSNPLRQQSRDMILERQFLKSKLYLKASKKLFKNESPVQIFNQSERIIIKESY